MIDRLVKFGEWLLLGKVAEQWINTIILVVCLFALIYFGWHIYRAMDLLVF